MPAVLRELHETPYAEYVPRLIRAAQEVRRKVSAPYSGFKVGAALLAYDAARRQGEIFVGTNVEQVDYIVTHAEASAISAYVASGQTSLPVMIVAVGSKDRDLFEAPVVNPCGKCRQDIYEWVRKRPEADINVIVFDNESNQPRLCSILELLPLSFG